MNSKFVFKNIVIQYGLILLLLLWILLDIFIRSNNILSFNNGIEFYWTAKYILFYLLSAMLSFQFLVLIRSFLYWIKLKSPKLAILLLGLVMLIWSIVFVGNWEFYEYFNVIPNFYTFQFMDLEPGETTSIISASINLSVILKIILLSSISFFLFAKHLKYFYPSKKHIKFIPAGSFVAAVLIWLVLNNNIRFVDQCLTPDTNTIVTLTKVKTHNPSTGYFNIAGLHAGNRPVLKKINNSKKFNIIFIINESLRSKNIPFYGYSKNTMPNLQNRFINKPEEFFIFKKSYANATSTMVAFPCLIAGATSTTSGRKLHEQPLIWDYAASLGYYTAIISSQIYNWRNMLTFLNSKNLDVLWYMEISGQKLIGQEYFGIDDIYTTEKFINTFQNSIEKKKSFFGILHTFDTHFPYYSPDSLKPFKGQFSDYDNSIYYLDQNIEKIFNFLETSNQIDSTIVFFTSDHGEAFKEHGINGHITNLFIETIQIPIWIKIPKPLQNLWSIKILRSNLDRSISNADLLPTLLDIFELYDKEEIRKIRDGIESQSLLRNIRDDRKLVLTNNTEYSVNRGNYFTSIIDDKYQFNIYLNSGKTKFEFFEFENDPFCQNNIWDIIPIQKKLEIQEILNKYENTKQIIRLLPGVIFN